MMKIMLFTNIVHWEMIFDIFDFFSHISDILSSLKKSFHKISHHLILLIIYSTIAAIERPNQNFFIKFWYGLQLVIWVKIIIFENTFLEKIIILFFHVLYKSYSCTFVEEKWKFTFVLLTAYSVSTHLLCSYI